MIVFGDSYLMAMCERDVPVDPFGYQCVHSRSMFFSTENSIIYIYFLPRRNEACALVCDQGLPVDQRFAICERQKQRVCM